MAKRTNFICIVPGCGSQAQAKKLCSPHYENTPERKEYKRQQYIKNKECHLAKQREWYNRTPEYQKQRSKKYREANRGQCLQRSKDYYHSTPAKQKEKYKRYYPYHKAEYTARTALRRTRLLQRTPKWSELESIKQFYNNCPPGYHVDHIIPLQGKNVSGLHVLENLQYLPAKENLSKGNKYG